METKIVDNQCIIEGNCPVCDKLISFSVENDMRIRANQIAGQVYEWFLNNNEFCFECRVLFEKWIKEHKGFCTENKIGTREVANKFLQKAGKEQIIGINTHKEAETEEISEVEVPVSSE